MNGRPRRLSEAAYSVHVEAALLHGPFSRQVDGILACLRFRSPVDQDGRLAPPGAWGSAPWISRKRINLRPLPSGARPAAAAQESANTRGRRGQPANKIHGGNHLQWRGQHPGAVVPARSPRSRAHDATVVGQLQYRAQQPARPTNMLRMARHVGAQRRIANAPNSGACAAPGGNRAPGVVTMGERRASTRQRSTSVTACAVWSHRG